MPEKKANTEKSKVEGFRYKAVVRKIGILKLGHVVKW